MILYRLRKDNFFHQDIGHYSSYGIDAVYDVSGVPIRSILDVSTEKGPLEDFIFLCNKLQLDSLHLDDVVEDFLP